MKIEEVIKTATAIDLPTKTVINLMYTTRVMEEAVSAILKE